MRSLIIIEVVHDETTDGVEALATSIANFHDSDIRVVDWAVKIDIPECFKL